MAYTLGAVGERPGLRPELRDPASHTYGRRFQTSHKVATLANTSSFNARK
jgi:hypothetical protein